MFLIKKNFKSRSFRWCNRLKQNFVSRRRQPHWSWSRYQICSICLRFKKSTRRILKHNFHEWGKYYLNLQYLWRFPSRNTIDDRYGNPWRTFHQNDDWWKIIGTSSFISQLFLQSTNYKPFWICCKQFHKIKRIFN